MEDETEGDRLRRRVEKELGWKEGAANAQSLSYLREAVRERNPKLAHLITDYVNSDRIIAQAVKKHRRRY